jgi:hypothetical protein
MEDKDKAEVQAGVYAEKPFRDALIEYKNQLSDEQKKALEMIATTEGQKAMAAYREAKSLEDPRITALRQNALQTVRLSEEARTYIAGGKGGEQRLAITEDLVKITAALEIDRTLADTTDFSNDFSKKAQRLGKLGAAIERGAQMAYYKPLTDYGIASLGRDDGPDVLRGYFISELANGKGGIGVLAEIAKCEGRQPEEVIADYVPMIAGVRKQHPRLNTDEFNPTRKPIDEGLLKFNFVWSPGTETFIHMGKGATPNPVVPAK